MKVFLVSVRDDSIHEIQGLTPDSHGFVVTALSGDRPGQVPERQGMNAPERLGVTTGERCAVVAFGCLVVFQLGQGLRGPNKSRSRVTVG
ncbi:hypothetical protein ACFVXQ_30010 [Kitasatospora sp. NPDC058263]